MSDVTHRPFSIRLFLPEGSPLGLTVATIPGWAGSVLRCRNASLPALLARPEAQRPGVYVLQGDDPNATVSQAGLSAYIGQGTIVGQRLPQSARNRDFWDIAVVVTTADTNFGAGHFLALEAIMISEARAAERVRLVNDAMPGDGAGALGEADRADINNFFEQVRLVFPLLGLDLLRPQPRVPSTTASHAMTNATVPENSSGSVEFCIRRSNRIIARAREIDGEFVVLEESEATTEKFVSNTYAALRSKLIKEGALIELVGSPFLRFTRNVPFSKPSPAAAVVLNRNSNGRTEWKVTDTGETYDQWQTGKSPPAPNPEETA